jgi:hypothetical protein
VASCEVVSRVCWVVVVLLLVYGSGLRGFCHGGRWVFSGVLRECSFSKCVWRVFKIWLGSTMISLVVGSLLMVARLGWSLSLRWRLATVLRLL